MTGRGTKPEKDADTDSMVAACCKSIKYLINRIANG